VPARVRASRKECHVNAVRGLFFPGLVVFVTALIGVWLSAESRAQTPAPATSINGAWTLNPDLSDKPPSESRSSEGDSGSSSRRGGGMGRGGMGGGRRGGGGGMGRGGMGGAAANPEDAQRLRDAMREIMDAPPHLTIVQTEAQMVVITTGDGLVSRLSPDGKKVKDENTKIERKAKWDGSKLVVEISGAVPKKMTETYEVDPGQHQLIITLATDAKPPVTRRHVYDADAR
jgi:hypothetical protein